MLSVRTYNNTHLFSEGEREVISIRLKSFRSFKELGLKIGDEFIELKIGLDDSLIKTDQLVRLIRIDSEDDAVGFFEINGCKEIEMIPFFKLAKIINLKQKSYARNASGGKQKR